MPRNFAFMFGVFVLLCLQCLSHQTAVRASSAVDGQGVMIDPPARADPGELDIDLALLERLELLLSPAEMEKAELLAQAYGLAYSHLDSTTSAFFSEPAGTGMLASTSHHEQQLPLVQRKKLQEAYASLDGYMAKTASVHVHSLAKLRENLSDPMSMWISDEVIMWYWRTALRADGGGPERDRDREQVQLQHVLAGADEDRRAPAGTAASSGGGGGTASTSAVSTASRVFVWDTFFWDYLSGNSGGSEPVGEWEKRLKRHGTRWRTPPRPPADAGTLREEVDLMLVPMNVGKHWALGMVDFLNKRFVYVCSMYDAERPEPMADVFAERMKRFLRIKYGPSRSQLEAQLQQQDIYFPDRGSPGGPGLRSGSTSFSGRTTRAQEKQGGLHDLLDDLDSWSIVRQEVSTQGNGWDCGLHMLLNCKHLIEEHKKYYLHLIRARAQQSKARVGGTPEASRTSVLSPVAGAGQETSATTHLFPFGTALSRRRAGPRSATPPRRPEPPRRAGSEQPRLGFAYNFPTAVSRGTVTAMRKFLLLKIHEAGGAKLEKKLWAVVDKLESAKICATRRGQHQATTREQAAPADAMASASLAAKARTLADDTKPASAVHLCPSGAANAAKVEVIEIQDSDDEADQQAAKRHSARGNQAEATERDGHPAALAMPTSYTGAALTPSPSSFFDGASQFSGFELLGETTSSVAEADVEDESGAALGRRLPADVRHGASSALSFRPPAGRGAGASRLASVNDTRSTSIALTTTPPPGSDQEEGRGSAINASGSWRLRLRQLVRVRSRSASPKAGGRFSSSPRYNTARDCDGAVSAASSSSSPALSPGGRGSRVAALARSLVTTTRSKSCSAEEPFLAEMRAGGKGDKFLLPSDDHRGCQNKSPSLSLSTRRQMASDSTTSSRGAPAAAPTTAAGIENVRQKRLSSASTSMADINATDEAQRPSHRTESTSSTFTDSSAAPLASGLLAAALCAGVVAAGTHVSSTLMTNASESHNTPTTTRKSGSTNTLFGSSRTSTTGATALSSTSSSMLLGAPSSRGTAAIGVEPAVGPLVVASTSAPAGMDGGAAGTRSCEADPPPAGSAPPPHQPSTVVSATLDGVHRTSVPATSTSSSALQTAEGLSVHVAEQVESSITLESLESSLPDFEDFDELDEVPQIVQNAAAATNPHEEDSEVEILHEVS